MHTAAARRIRFPDWYRRLIACEQQWQCNVCHTLLPHTFEIDHVRPLWAGGSADARTNLQALCNTCHSAKTVREASGAGPYRAVDGTCALCKKNVSRFFAHACASDLTR